MIAVLCALVHAACVPDCWGRDLLCLQRTSSEAMPCCARAVFCADCVWCCECCHHVIRCNVVLPQLYQLYGESSTANLPPTTPLRACWCIVCTQGNVDMRLGDYAAALKDFTV